MKVSHFLFSLVLCLLLGSCVSTTTRPLPKGDPGTTGIASLEKIRLGGVDQWILVRGTDATTPLILMVHGGPGVSEIPAIGFNQALEQDFVVVQWDQRGTGKSAPSIDPSSAVTLEQISNDTVELTKALLARFHKPKLILVGFDWGSVVALKAIQKAPQLYLAYVGAGQIVETGASAPWSGPQPIDRTTLVSAAPEFSWWERLQVAEATKRSQVLLSKDWQTVNLKQQVPKVGVPVYLAVGRLDPVDQNDLIQQWFDTVRAPRKVWRWFEASGHYPQYEENDAFERFLEEVAGESGAS